jgi:hypothetical protein
MSDSFNEHLREIGHVAGSMQELFVTRMAKHKNVIKDQ